MWLTRWLLAFAFDASPCFPDRASIDVTAAFEVLQPHGPQHGGGDGTFGTCTVAGGLLRTRHGVAIGEVHCGLVVSARGFVDGRGTGIGHAACLRPPRFE